MTSTSASLGEELAAVKSWLADQALPLWGSTGFDRSTLLFEERLDFAGRPIFDAPRRLMVQCRQIYVFAQATMLGWFDGREIVALALPSVLSAYGERAAGVPYVFSLSRQGAVTDARQDTYSYAFLLFALAWARKLLGRKADGAVAEALIAHLRANLLHPSRMGFVDGLPRHDNNLRQNPQMHLLEAALAVAEAFSSSQARTLADDLYRLFRERLFDAGRRALPERHDDDWRLADPSNAAFEPGHHFEWIWLLRDYARQSGENVEDLVDALSERAYAEGVDENGAVIEAMGLDGAWRSESRRCWGVCEGLKAAASDFEVGARPELARRRAASFLRALRSLFLSAPLAGGWVDRIDAHGAPLIDYAPASTLYHIVLAVAEADRVFTPHNQ